jgi:hypothetical protein
MVQVRVDEYDPVLYLGSSVRMKVTFAEFGLAVLHGAPPPVHAEAPSHTTVVAAVVLTVWTPEHATPKVVPLQV